MDYDDTKFNLHKCQRLAQYREARNIKIVNAAKQLDVGRDTLRNWENGEQAPREGNRRADLIFYLWDYLLLRESPEEFDSLWIEVMVGEWEWTEIDDDEARRLGGTYEGVRGNFSRIATLQQDLRQARQDAGLRPWPGMTWQEFHPISNHRHKLTERLAPAELAFALRCSIQHGKDRNFWSRVNRYHRPAAEELIRFLMEDHGRRPLLRAGHSLERFQSDLQQEIVRRTADHIKKLAVLGNTIEQRVIDAALKRETTQLWKGLRNDLTYGPLIDQLVREALEPDD